MAACSSSGHVRSLLCGWCCLSMVGITSLSVCITSIIVIIFVLETLVYVFIIVELTLMMVMLPFKICLLAVVVTVIE
jgi:hypothetical protein